MPNAFIAVVDDEEELRENLTDLLEFKDYKVAAFATGEAFLQQFDSLDLDLILLDIQLPGIDGLGILEIVKKKKPNLPVAIVSASSVPTILEKAEQIGADAIVLKPYTLQNMLEKVEELLKKGCV